MPGVWRTVRGRKVFINEGEDLSSAMEKSGKFDNLWKYPGIEEQVKKIEDEVENVKSFNRATALRVAIDAQEKVINQSAELIENGIEKGDIRALMSYRRRLRIAKKKLIEKKVMG